MAWFWSQPNLKILEDKESNNQKEEQKNHQEQDQITEHSMNCINLYKRGGGGGGRGETGQWKQEQRLRASRMELHLAEEILLEDLIQEQLSRFDAYYSRSIGSNRQLKDISQILMPKFRHPLEMSSLAWFGNWRPSAILSLLHSLIFFRSSSPSSSSSSIKGERVLSQLIRETRVEEAVLDEEMAEIQSNCILHLPFFSSTTLLQTQSSDSTRFSDLASVSSEFAKIDRVLTRAQKLRYKTLELVVKKLLTRAQAAAFLVAFTGIQDMVHEVAICRNRQKRHISVTVKPFGM